jgi:cobyrinic acid a,c-diamide synthase
MKGICVADVHGGAGMPIYAEGWHDSHYSETISGGSGIQSLAGVYEANGPGGGGQPWGLSTNNTLASYVPPRFGSKPRLAPNLMESARRWRQ